MVCHVLRLAGAADQPDRPEITDAGCIGLMFRRKTTEHSDFSQGQY